MWSFHDLLSEHYVVCICINKPLRQEIKLMVTSCNLLIMSWKYRLYETINPKTYITTYGNIWTHFSWFIFEVYKKNIAKLGKLWIYSYYYCYYYYCYYYYHYYYYYSSSKYCLDTIICQEFYLRPKVNKGWHASLLRGKSTFW